MQAFYVFFDNSPLLTLKVGELNDLYNPMDMLHIVATLLAIELLSVVGTGIILTVVNSFVSFAGTEWQDLDILHRQGAHHSELVFP